MSKKYLKIVLLLFFFLFPSIAIAYPYGINFVSLKKTNKETSSFRLNILTIFSNGCFSREKKAEFYKRGNSIGVDIFYNNRNGPGIVCTLNIVRDRHTHWYKNLKKGLYTVNARLFINGYFEEKTSDYFYINGNSAVKKLFDFNQNISLIPFNSRKGEKIKIKSVVQVLRKARFFKKPYCPEIAVSFYKSDNHKKTVKGDIILSTVTARKTRHNDKRIAKYKLKDLKNFEGSYIKAVLDSKNEIMEYDENNNIAVSRKIRTQ